MLRETPLPKSPTTLTNEQVEAWMRANPDRVQRLDSTDYDHSVSHQIKVKDRDRKRVTPLNSQAIKDALAKQQRKARRVPISFGTKAANPDKSIKPVRIAKPHTPPIGKREKRRLDFLKYLQATGETMPSGEVKAKFGFSDPKFVANRINRDGDYIAITKGVYRNRETWFFTATKRSAA